METKEFYLQKYGLDTLLDMYRRMVLIRDFEENIKILYQNSLATGAMHLSVGEEACAVGACFALEERDKFVTYHRGHGHNIAKGADVGRMVAELMARKDGLCKGRSGSMHIFDASIGALGAQGIVGAQVPIACGIAFSAKLRGLDYVTASFFGDGASNNGAFHEGMNMAAIMNLPVVFICINNGWAVTTPVTYSVKAESIAIRAKAYGMEGVVVDGCNVLEVRDAVGKAVEKARTGGGPTLIELKAYRWYGHYVGDDTSRYRNPDDEKQARDTMDPIKIYSQWLLSNGLCGESDLREMEAQAKQIIEDANEFAMNSEQPSIEDMYAETYYIPEGGDVSWLS